ncbi:MAG: glutathione S-transferase family protein [Halioglobus sp.]|nr:glutathione S-transferase family protein [Halioglobus sp.]
MYRGEYELVGNELSMFTRKLEAQLRFQHIPWRWHFKTFERAPDIEARAGTHFIPVLRTPEKWLIHDTIALGPLLNDRFSETPVIPATPIQRALCFVLEDVFNHWLGRVAVHTRWCYPDNVSWVGPRFGANSVLDRSIEEPLSDEEIEELTPIGKMMYENFGKNVCEYNGVGPDQEESVRADYTRMMTVLAGHFAAHKFLLGDRPCLADFALAGASKAHFITDPVPLEWLGEHRDMLAAYCDRLYGDHDLRDAQWLLDDAVPDSLSAVLDYVQATYLNFARANISAGLAGEKYYEYDYGFGPTRARTQRRLNMARLHVRDELEKVGAANNAGIQALLGERGILTHYLDD